MTQPPSTPPPSAHEGLIQPVPKGVSYASYLRVNDLLALQQPLSSPAVHDETLFIVIHQVYELWFKQILHEVERAAQALADDQPMVFLNAAKRIGKIQNVLTHQVDILETMTPVDFNSFREHLNPASGFQSFQFRVLEFRLGGKDQSYLRFHQSDPLATKAMDQALRVPSLYDHLLHLLSRRGFTIPAAVLTRDVTQPYEASDAVLQTILKIYRESDRHYDLYSTIEAFIDLDEGLLLWRQRHVTMVERMIGGRKGTGGSSGAKYLAATLSKRFFPEIWDARNWLGVGGSSYGNQQDAGTGAKQS